MPLKEAGLFAPYLSVEEVGVPAFLGVPVLRFAVSTP